MLPHNHLKGDKNYLPTTPSLVCNYKTKGWDPIDHFARLAAYLLELELRRPGHPAKSRWDKLRKMALTARRGKGAGAIYLAGSPAAIKSIVTEEDFSSPKQFRVLWIVDSF